MEWPVLCVIVRLVCVPFGPQRNPASFRCASSPLVVGRTKSVLSIESIGEDYIISPASLPA